MSYNTRRNSGFGTPQASSVGQRRQPVSNNFVPGGQLAGSQQKPPAHQQRAPQQQQQQSGINFRNQNNAAPPPSQPNFQSPQAQQPVIKQEPPPKPTQAPAPQMVAPVLPGANPPAPDQHDDDMESVEGSVKKRFWNKTKSIKISRAEKVRRRNMKLSKILQPKNAVMILNELVRGCVYTVDELPVKVDVNQFRGTVSFDGLEFAGTGRTKNAAKNSAAETALKHLVKNKQITNVRKDESGDEKMDIEEESSQVMPWSHIASFAMYKLFSTWGEDPNTAQDIMSGNANVGKPGASGEPRPAKKMPDNPETMNPLMLMHQMLPMAVWEEVGKSGNPPNVMFKFSVTIEGKEFTGSGSSKKAAKKQAAFSACHQILKINYPPDVWSPMY